MSDHEGPLWPLLPPESPPPPETGPPEPWDPAAWDFEIIEPAPPIAPGDGEPVVEPGLSPHDGGIWEHGDESGDPHRSRIPRIRLPRRRGRTTSRDDDDDIEVPAWLTPSEPEEPRIRPRWRRRRAADDDYDEPIDPVVVTHDDYDDPIDPIVVDTPTRRKSDDALIARHSKDQEYDPPFFQRHRLIGRTPVKTLVRVIANKADKRLAIASHHPRLDRLERQAAAALKRGDTAEHDRRLAQANRFLDHYQRRYPHRIPRPWHVTQLGDNLMHAAGVNTYRVLRALDLEKRPAAYHAEVRRKGMHSHMHKTATMSGGTGLTYQLADKKRSEPGYGEPRKRSRSAAEEAEALARINENINVARHLYDEPTTPTPGLRVVGRTPSTERTTDARFDPWFDPTSIASLANHTLTAYQVNRPRDEAEQAALFDRMIEIYDSQIREANGLEDADPLPEGVPEALKHILIGLLSGR